jgi:hypothetical protein
VSVTGMLGYSLTVFGVILYSEAKKRSKWCVFLEKLGVPFSHSVDASARRQLPS